MNIALNVGTAVLLLLASYWDIKEMRIPNRLTMGGLAVGVIFQAIAGGGWGLLGALSGMLAGLLPMLALYALKGIGAGDVKLFGALGAWMGAGAVLSVLLYSMLAAGCIGLLLLLGRKLSAGVAQARFARLRMPLLFGKEMKNEASGKMRLHFPFMLAVLPGAGIYLL